MPPLTRLRNSSVTRLCNSLNWSSVAFFIYFAPGNKAALIAATKHAAVSLVQHGVLINSVAPGSVSHPQGSWEKFQNDNTKETVDDFIKNNLPMGKFGWAEPVGDLVAFLSSDRIGFMAGSCIVIDGGQSYSML